MPLPTRLPPRRQPCAPRDRSTLPIPMQFSRGAVGGLRHEQDGQLVHHALRPAEARRVPSSRLHRGAARGRPPACAEIPRMSLRSLQWGIRWSVPVLFQAHGASRRPSASRSREAVTSWLGRCTCPVDRPVAAVVTTGPLTSVKEQATGAYARALSGRGFAALAFDHRTFGESGGQPRQLEQPEGKAADVTAAVTALGADERTREPPGRSPSASVPGAATWPGAVADDTRLRAFAGVAGYYSDAAAFADVVPGRVPGGDRPRTSRGTALARDRRGRDHPGRRARRRGRGDAAPRGVRVLRHEPWCGGQLHQRLRRPVVRVHDAVRRPRGGGPHSGAVPPRPLRAGPRSAPGPRSSTPRSAHPSRSCGCSRRVRSTSTTIPASSAPPPTPSLTGSRARCHSSEVVPPRGSRPPRGCLFFGRAGCRGAWFRGCGDERDGAG